MSAKELVLIAKEKYDSLTNCRKDIQVNNSSTQTESERENSKSVLVNNENELDVSSNTDEASNAGIKFSVNQQKTGVKRAIRSPVDQLPGTLSTTRKASRKRAIKWISF